jgi:outer membrane protein assembly factor BamB
MRRLIGIVGMLFFLATVSAGAQSVPSSTWPMYQFRPDHAAVFTDPDLHVSWKVKVGKANGAFSIVGTTLYVESFDFKLYAIDVKTGSVLWVKPLPSIAMNAPLVEDGRVIVGTGVAGIVKDAPDVVAGEPLGDDVLAFDAATGKELWSYHTAGENMPTGVFSTINGKDAFIFSNGDGHAYALSIADGSLIWKQAIPGVSSMSSLALSGGIVYGSSTLFSPRLSKAAAATGDVGWWHRMTWVWALDPSSGHLIWTNSYGHSDSSPTVGNGTVLSELHVPIDGTLATYRNIVYASDATNGALRWSYASQAGPLPIGISGEQSIAGLYAGDEFFESLPIAREFDAFDARTGRVRWVMTTIGSVKMSAIAKDGNLYFGDTEGTLYVVRQNSGQLIARVRFPGSFTPSPPIAIGGTLFVSNGNWIYALRIEDIERGTLEFAADSDKDSGKQDDMVMSH